MTVTRRKFLAMSGAAVAGATTASAIPSWFASPAAAATAFPTRAQFAQVVGTPFRIYVTSTRILTVSLTSLTDVAARSAPGVKMSGESFSLLFTGSVAQGLPQGIYAFQSNRIGTFDMFVVSSVVNNGAPKYVAVVNRALPVAA